ncbi:TPA: hypothetical protein U2M17_002286 [Providencia stuartii]|nr:hypothetical protein [Providencia stuartii]HEM7174072.1 hypothetical protein [Providencia stuartii]HEM8202667.1 hypothetical protein [Providencia stuartii]
MKVSTLKKSACFMAANQFYGGEPSFVEDTKAMVSLVVFPIQQKQIK